MLLYRGVTGNPISRQFSETRRKTMQLLRKQSDTFFMLPVLIFNRDSSISQDTI